MELLTRAVSYPVHRARALCPRDFMIWRKVIFFIVTLISCTVYEVRANAPDPFCSTKVRPPGAGPIRIRLPVEQGETFEIKCKFCGEIKNDPINWYFRERLSRVNRRKEYVEVDGLELEITADPFTFDEFNRIFVEKDTLVIRKFNYSDAGKYYCRRFPTRERNDFDYEAQLLLRKEPSIVPIDKTFTYVGKSLMKLTRDYHGQDRQGRPFTLVLNQLQASFEPGKWSECSSCGDTPGEQERFSECRVKFIFPHGHPMPEYVGFLLGPTLDDPERRKLESAVFDPYATLIEDYEELRTPSAIEKTCHEDATARRSDSFEACRQRLQTEDVGHTVGMGCRNQLFLNRWAYYASQNSLEHIFPPPELLGGLIESRTCTSKCSPGAAAKSAVNLKAKKLLKKKGLNLGKILKQQKRRAKARVPKRHVTSEYEGTGVKLSCPGAKLDHLLLWKNGTLDLNPFLVATETNGRISYINHLVLHIRNLTKHDSQVYSCWQNNELHGEVEIKVVKPKEAPPDMRVALLYLAVGTLCDVLIFLGLMVVRHRQRLTVRMKGYKELYDDGPSAKNLS